jgi:hypothetical protein
MPALKSDVRFTLQSRHPTAGSSCPKSARLGHGELKSRKRKSRPKAALNSQLPISKLGGHQQRGSLQLEELLQEGLNVLMGFVRRRFLVVAARKPFFIARIAWRERLLRLDV